MGGLLIFLTYRIPKDIKLQYNRLAKICLKAAVTYMSFMHKKLIPIYYFLFLWGSSSSLACATRGSSS